MQLPLTLAPLHSLHIGQPQTLGTPDADNPLERPWTSAIHKQPVTHTLWLDWEGLTGDAVADTKIHGGREKALLAYHLGHYTHWQKVLRQPIGAGGFGENLTLSDQHESTVCLGDQYQLGNARIEVSQPRQPCWKLARRWQVKDLALQVQDTGYTGWYFRVLEPGEIAPGQPLILVARPHPEWTIAHANRVMHRHNHPDELRDLAACKALTPGWKKRLSEWAEMSQKPDNRTRLYGQNL
jgi:MOSC domain-containing protein YiiM